MSGIYSTGGYALLVSEVDSSDFCCQSGYFDISLGRGEHRSMKYERVPRDFRNGLLTSVVLYDYNFFAYAEARLFISAILHLVEHSDTRGI